MTDACLLFLAAVAVSWVLGFAVRPVLRRLGCIDRPNARSSHTRPTLRGGGLAIMLTILGGGLVAAGPAPSRTFATALAAGLALAAVSFWDDLRPLPARLRLMAHSLAAFALLWTLLRAPGIVPLPDLPAARLALVAGSFLWLVGYTNAFNFMDGINGLAAMQALTAGLGTAALGYLATGSWSDPAVLLATVTAGAAAGFLPHNFPAARMFMGDVSSAPLGFLLAAACLDLASRAGWWFLLPLILLHANFVLDTGTTLARRMARGDRWYEPHREHFYQRLIRAGRSHAWVTGAEFVLQSASILLILMSLGAAGSVRVLLLSGVVVLWSLFFVAAERTFQRHLARGVPAGSAPHHP